MIEARPHGRQIEGSGSLLAHGKTGRQQERAAKREAVPAFKNPKT
jgi:hypothetical protein